MEYKRLFETLLAQHIDAYMIMLFIRGSFEGFDELTVLAWRSLHLKDRVIHPLTMRREYLLHHSPAFVVSDVVGDEEVHGKIIFVVYYFLLNFLFYLVVV